MNFSYDYDELIQELKEDIEDGLVDDLGKIWIIRSIEPVFEGYRPIVDYYYIDDLKPNKLFQETDKFRAVKVPVAKIIEEMERLNSII